MIFRNWIWFILAFLSGCACEFTGLEHIEVTMTPYERMVNEQKVVTIAEALTPPISIKPAFTATEIESIDQLQSLYFDFNKSSLSKEQSKILIKNAKILTLNPYIKISLKIHPDNVGVAKYNNRLSKKRADKIKIQLRAKGITSERLEIVVVPQEKDSAISFKKIKDKKKLADLKLQTKKDRKLEFIVQTDEVITNPGRAIAEVKSDVIKAGNSDELSAGNLKTVYFEYKQKKILGDQYEILKSNAEELRKNPKLKILISAHTDGVGGIEYNKKLGLSRAKYVKNEFLARGVKAEQLEIETKGPDGKLEEDASSSVKTYEDRLKFKGVFNKNRRVNFVVMDPEKNKIENAPVIEIAKEKKVEEVPVKISENKLEVLGESDLFTAGKIQTVYFEYKQKKIIGDQFEILKKNAAELKNNPQLKVLISAHTDGVGGVNYNKKLGLLRANYIRNELVAMGVKSNQLDMETKGPDGKLEEDASSSVKTYEDRLKFKGVFNKNRRVNFIVQSVEEIKPKIEEPAPVIQLAEKVKEEKDPVVTAPIAVPENKLVVLGESDLFTAGKIQTVYFEYKQKKIIGDQFEILKKNAAELKNNPQLKVLISAHTDGVGGVNYNKKLGLARANYIRNELVALGVKSNQLEMETKGPDGKLEEDASSSVKTYEDRLKFKGVFNKNRRVNFIVQSIEEIKPKIEEPASVIQLAEKVKEEKDPVVTVPVAVPENKLEVLGESDLFTAGKIQTVYFEYKQKKIIGDQFEILKKNATELKNNPQIKVLISAHTDGVGGVSYNKKLGLLRANYIRNELVAMGVKSNQLEMETKGPDGKLEEDASDSVKTYEDRLKFKGVFNKNRRVNFIVQSLEGIKSLPAPEPNPVAVAVQVPVTEKVITNSATENVDKIYNVVSSPQNESKFKRVLGLIERLFNKKGVSRRKTVKNILKEFIAPKDRIIMRGVYKVTKAELGLLKGKLYSKIKREVAQESVPTPKIITPDKLFEFKEIYFEYKQSKISNNQLDIIKSSANYLKNNDKLKITIVGSADREGSKKASKNLALKRAKYVKKIFVELGVNPTQLKIKSEVKKSNKKNKFDRRVKLIPI